MPRQTVPGVFDLHTHQTLKTQLFKFKLTKKYKNPSGTFPLTVRNHWDALQEGGVKALLCAHYVLEREMQQDVWPIKLAAKVYPPLKEMFQTPPDAMGFKLMDQLEHHVGLAQAAGVPVAMARSKAELQTCIDEDKLAVVHSLEGAHHLNGDLDNLQRFFDRGVCHMILPHFYANDASGCVDPIPSHQPMRWIGCWNYPRDPEAGITAFGQDLIDRMLHLGMIVDMSHATPTGRKQILDQAGAATTKRPIIMSHVGVHALMPHPMNPTAEEIRRIADTGGVVGLLFMSFFMEEPWQAHNADSIRKSVAHLVEHGGEDVVAFGSDFDGFTETPKDFRSPRDYVRVREVLRQDYSEAQIEKFLFGNAHRVLREGWGR